MFCDTNLERRNILLSATNTISLEINTCKFKGSLRPSVGVHNKHKTQNTPQSPNFKWCIAVNCWCYCKEHLVYFSQMFDVFASTTCSINVLTVNLCHCTVFCSHKSGEASESSVGIQRPRTNISTSLAFILF